MRLRAKGLIRGASTQNAVVVGEDGVVENELRWPDEFVRHKAMDCVGDLALAGARVRARVQTTRPSHRGTVLLVRAMKEAAREAETMKDLTTSEASRIMDVEDIMKVLPHRYPFLLVDRILELEPGKRVVGVKNVTINEPFFQGHFPGHPIMPGVLIIEAMAQVGGMLLLGAIEDPQSKVVYFTSLNNVKWRRPVKPGDQLRFELDVLQVRGPDVQDAGSGQGRRRDRRRGRDGCDGARPMSARIHPTALISRDAQLGDGVEVGPFAIIGDGCVVGDECVIAARDDARAQCHPRARTYASDRERFSEAIPRT